MVRGCQRRTRQSGGGALTVTARVLYVVCCLRVACVWSYTRGNFIAVGLLRFERVKRRPCITACNALIAKESQDAFKKYHLSFDYQTCAIAPNVDRHNKPNLTVLGEGELHSRSDNGVAAIRLIDSSRAYFWLPSY